MSEEAGGRHIDFSSPRGYYLDYASWADAGCAVNDNGVPGVRGRDGAFTPSPQLVSRVALGNLEIYLENGSVERKDRFESLVGWLVDHQEIIPGSFGGWPMPALPGGLGNTLGEGWFSGGVHAECLSTLVRAWALLRTDGAREAARRAFGGLRTSGFDGGFLREIGDGVDVGGLPSLAFIDEFPSVERAPMVFESHVRGLWAAFDFSFIDVDGSARGLFERCTEGLSFVLEQYDLGYWTRADLRSGRGARRPNSERGIRTQVVMLEILGSMTAREEFDSTSRRWRSYVRSPGKRMRALIGRAIRM